MPDEVIRLAERVLVEVLKEFALRCGGVAVEECGLLLVTGNHPCPVFMNSVFRIGEMDASEVLARAEAFFGKRGHRYEVWIRDGADADLEQAALAAGMRVAVELSGMVLHRRPEVPKMSSGLEVRRVEDIEGVQDFASVVAEGFRDEAPGLSEMVRATFSEPRSLIAADTAAFVVWDRNEPASAAMTMMKEGVAWIGWVATRPEFRGRGLGQLATTTATRAGFALGAKFAWLEATKMGVPVYLRLGYREVLPYRTYWPVDSH